jgi:hypothetical protein
MESNNFDNVKPATKSDRLRQAELEMYHDLLNSTPGHFNTEQIMECSKDTIQYFNPTVPFDNMAYLTDLIVDDRIRKNHADWVEETKPWAGTATILAPEEFSAGDYVHFVGLRRPHGVQQDNPWQITEVDESQLENKRYVI